MNAPARRWGGLITILAVLGLLVATPLGAFLALSFGTVEGGTINRAFSTANYQEIFANPTYAGVIWQTVLLSGGVMVSTVLIGFPIAFFVWTRPERSRFGWLIAFSLPLLMSYIVKVYTMRTLLGTNGPLNTLLVWTGILERPTPALLHNKLAIFITMTAILLPFVILPIYLALARIPRKLIEAAADIGARPIDTFRYVIVPLAIPGTLAGGLFAFILAFGDYVTPQMVGGPTGFTVGRIIWSQFGLAYNWPFGAALGAAVLIMALLTIALAGLLSRREQTS